MLKTQEETEIMRMPMNGEKTIEDVLEIDDFTNATTQLKVVSSDGRAGEECCWQCENLC